MKNFFHPATNKYCLCLCAFACFANLQLHAATSGNRQSNFANFAQTEESVTLVTDSIVQETIRKTQIDLQSHTPAVVNRTTGPTVFSGYRHRSPHRFKAQPVPFTALFTESAETFEPVDTESGLLEELYEAPGDSASVEARMAMVKGQFMPRWLVSAIRNNTWQDNFLYDIMMSDPKKIDYAYWELPEPPRLPDDDVSFAAYIKRLDLPKPIADAEKIEVADLKKRHWLHVVEGGVQFSQAYLSSNWYQGGNDYLALLFNFLWDVQLNTVYHPNLMFNSTLSYKLGLNSTPNDKFHKYSISQDLFQYNMKAGVKAFTSWFYSFNMQFKTQLLNNYPVDSQERSASFLSPGDLNMGLGMTYNHNNKNNTFKLSVSISPLSFNMKTCIDNTIDHAQFNIAPDKKFRAEFGSNAEMNFDWQLTSNINWRNRVFLFTDYSYFLGDMENTFSFTLNKFLSTQLYVHLRYDTSNDASTSRWRHWMLKEILSFGLTYRFSTK